VARLISIRSWLLILGVVVSVSALARLGIDVQHSAASKAKRGIGVRAEVVRSRTVPAPVAKIQAPGGFSPQLRLGYTVGDQWEPAIAADSAGSVYVLYPQYGGVPGCASCPSPTAILLVSRDRGATWAAPRQIAPPGTGQVDTQIEVDPVDGSTVFASWLQNGKSDTVVARSTDSGNTWSVVIADHTNAGTDKPILAVRGQDVYVGFNHAQKVWLASSHDGGRTFTSVNVNPKGNQGWSLAGGGAVAPNGTVSFSWAGYAQNGGAKGPVNLYLSTSTNGGASWTTRTLDVSASPPDCSAQLCGWAYLGAQITLAADASGTFYALWNSGTVAKGPERIYFSRSFDGGATWSPKQDVSAATAGVAHAFPAITAGLAGDVRISWMDARVGGLWNTYYRSSADGGQTWTSERDLSPFVSGYSYIQPGGFSFPFGDYYEIAIDDQGSTHVIWGEGLNYQTPGSIWYARGK